jgi:Cof subfamily protein (haloacid dehalogenase superfamily)
MAAAWSAAAEAGIETVLVTARPPRWLHDLEQVVGPRGTAICCNGAFVYEVATHRVLETHCFEAGVVDDLVADLRRAVPSVTFAAERASGPFVADDYPDPHRDRGASRAVHGPWRELAVEPVGKLLALAPELPLDEFLATVEEVVGTRGHLHFSGAHGLAEVNAPGVTKAAGLERWATRLGIDAAQVWAFGDMPNDLPMLEWAGIGWAVANGHEQVRRVADRQCPANDDDGVASVLEALLAQKV